MIISRVPVRLSMGGGGTDLPAYYKKFGGFLMAATIDRYIFAALNKRYNKTIRLSYSQTEIVDNLKDIKHNIIREALKLVNVKKQIEIVSIADIPSKCGLGTSSAFCVALLQGLYAFKRKSIGIHDLAELACHIEIDILKAPIGKQDQYATCKGGFNAYWFDRSGKVFVEPVDITTARLKELQNNLLLVYLNKNRSASLVLSEQNKKLENNVEDTVNRLHKIKKLGLETKKIFEHGKLDAFGEILHEHWLTKKGLTDKVSSSFIDEVYGTSLKNGAIGGKVIGAGGGGFLLLYCPKEKSRLISALKKVNLKPMWFSFEHTGAKIIFNQ